MTNSDSDPVDDLLVMQAQEGDRQAFETIVRRWQRRLWTHAYRLAASSDAAWDITQEAWIAIVKGLRNLRDPAMFRLWAYRIVSNKSMDYLKSRPRNHAASPARAESERPPQECTTILRQLLDRLEPNKKLILVLYYIEGLSLAELALVLGVPEGTVKSRLHASRNAFRLLWQQHAGETSHER
jgi:RNA polymerase sigma-70 factor (ECF subfamily)